MTLSSNTLSDPAFLNAALEGLESQKQRLEEQIAEVRQLLGKSGGRKASRSAAAPAAEEDGRPKRQMSAAARKRIAEAQKKRWAEYRKQKEQ
jgi:cell division septum initiation protein DivIVA